MVFAGARSIGNDALEDRCNSAGPHREACFFKNLPNDGIFQTLAGFHNTSRERPVAG